MENQELINLLNGLKEARFIYNDADFCRKTGIQPSFLSEMKAGKKPFSPLSRKKIEETFPEYFGTENDIPTLGDVARMLVEHDVRFHDQMDRILDAMGVAPSKKEKSA